MTCATGDRVSRWLLLAAAAVLILQAGAHAGMLLLAAYPEAASPVVEAMRTIHFRYGGRETDFWRLYEGYAFLAALMPVALAGLIVIAASSLEAGRALARRILMALIIILLAHAAFTVWRFFLAPAIFDTAAAGLIAGAIWRLR